MSSFFITTFAIIFVAGLCLVSGCAASKSNSNVSMGAVSADSPGYICPLTGQELPCPKCCPLNKE